MNKGQGIQPVITALNDLKENKYDILVDTQNPELKAVRDERGVMLQVPSPRHGGESRLFGINPIAHAHIATANDIPKRYYDRMKTEHPDLLIENINEWLMTMKNKTKLVRTLHGSVRAIMSNGYRPLDVDQLFEAALPTVQALDLETRSIALTERNFYWKVVHKEMTGEIKVGKVMRAGAMIKGSDVGCSKAVGAMWWEETICTNGWVVEKTIDKVHIGARTLRMGTVQLSSSRMRPAPCRIRRSCLSSRTRSSPCLIASGSTRRLTCSVRLQVNRSLPIPRRW